MIIPLAAILGLLLPALMGGDLRHLANVRIRAIRVAVCAFLVQLFAVSFLGGPEVLLSTTHIASYLIVTYSLWQNRRLPGIPILAAGALCNGITILANGGTLPARAAALSTAGLTDGSGFVNSGVLEYPRLAVLGDIFAVPASVPLANVFSIGDLLIVTGATWASLRVCGTRWSTPWRPTSDHAVQVIDGGQDRSPMDSPPTNMRAHVSPGSTVLRRPRR